MELDMYNSRYLSVKCSRKLASSKNHKLKDLNIFNIFKPYHVKLFHNTYRKQKGMLSKNLRQLFRFQIMQANNEKKILIILLTSHVFWCTEYKNHYKNAVCITHQFFHILIIEI